MKKNLEKDDLLVRIGGDELSLKGIVFDFNGTMYIDGDKQEAAWFEFFQRHANEIGRAHV